MREPDIIGKLHKKWTLIAVASDVLLSGAVTLVAAILLSSHPVYPWWAYFYIFFLSMMFAGIRHKHWKWEPADIARHLNSRMPQFQESAQLLLRPAGSLSLLEQLQVNRIEQAVRNSRLPFPNKNMQWSVILLLGSLLLVKLLYPLPGFSSTRALVSQPSGTAKRTVTEKRLAAVSAVTVQIRPPAYTGRPSVQQSVFTIQSPEGSEAVWQIQTNDPVQQVNLRFNDKEMLALHGADGSHTRWTVQKKLLLPGFYQVKIEDRLSEMYMIDLVKDAPPQVRIVSPKQYTTVDFGEPQRISVRVSASDDYGLGKVFMSATIASGSGEGVKFKEQQFPLSGPVAGSRETGLQRRLDLRALGMKPGDELYYYASATDNHGQETRSDVYTINLPDTAQLMQLEGLTNSVSLKQEYFRSQRQIIIETEQLLKDRDTISAAAFNNKSNNLGIDQKLLRLRYGKFLGEENENEMGGEHGHEGEHEEHDETVFGDASKLMQQYIHQHDNAEDATFFDPKQKAQLRATLSEMWKAELQLRLYKPAGALPFEYKALRLLKDLQQQSRSYVAKAAYKTTPLRPEKRLTADLSKIVEPLTSQTVKTADEQDQLIRQAAGILESLKLAVRPTPAAAGILQKAAQSLGKGAIASPGVYLASFDAMKRVLSSLDHPAFPAQKDLNLAEKGLQTLVGHTQKSPRREEAGLQQLSKQYFKNLQQGGH